MPPSALDPNVIKPGDRVYVESPITPRGTDIRGVRPGDTCVVLEVDRKLGGTVTMVRVRMSSGDRRYEHLVFAREALITFVEREALAKTRRRVWPLAPAARARNGWDAILDAELYRAKAREDRIVADTARLDAMSSYVLRSPARRPGAVEGRPGGSPFNNGGYTYGPNTQPFATDTIDSYLSRMSFTIPSPSSAPTKTADYDRRKAAAEDAARIISRHGNLRTSVTDLAEFLLEISA